MLIRSGCVFIYEENASGIKRWTDGVTWSPSRILGNFLVYRELDKPFPPGEKKRAMKKNSRTRPSRPGEPYPRPLSTPNTYSPTTPSSATFSSERAPNEMERSLIGSLIDSYGFKADGLVKKTMSVTVQGVTHHLVSYYSVTDVVNGHLRTPSQTENLNYVRPRPELTSKQSFRSPLEETEDLEGIREHHLAVQAPYGYRASQLTHHGYMPPPGPYYGSGIYPPGSNHLVTSAGYHAGTSAIAGSYMPPPMLNPQLAHRGEEYGQYHPPSFSRSYESSNTNVTSNAHGTNLGSSSSSSTATNLHARNPPHHLALYSQASPQPRTSKPSPVSGVVRTPISYTRSSFSRSINATQPPQHADPRRSIRSSPILKPQLREADQITNTTAPSPVYAHDRSHFYMNPHSAPLAHGNYHPTATIPSWPAQTAAHQQI